MMPRLARNSRASAAVLPASVGKRVMKKLVTDGYGSRPSLRNSSCSQGSQAPLWATDFSWNSRSFTAAMPATRAGVLTP